MKVSRGPRICSTVTDTLLYGGRAWAVRRNPELMTVPKKQSTAAKKARAIQRAAGGKHTALLAEQTCGEKLDPWGEFPETCARAPHALPEPHSEDRNFDAAAWRAELDAQEAEAQRQWEAMTSEERAEAEELAYEQAYDDGGEQPSDWIDYQED